VSSVSDAEVPHPDPPEKPVVLEVVEVDTHIERADLGPGNYTFIAAGDTVPFELADLPRQPAHAPPRRVRRATKKS
jgi:hypothetical protein